MKVPFQIMSPVRSIPGAIFGAGLASLAHAAGPAMPPSFGPPLIVIFGFDVPVLSALFGVLGVLLARRVAPPSAVDARLGREGRAALTVLLALGVLALIIAGQKQPIVALGWSIGLGFSGIAVVELLASAVMGSARVALKAFTRGAAAEAAAWADKEDPK